MLEWVVFKLLLDELRNSINQNNDLKLYELLTKTVPLFNPQCDLMDALFKEKK